MPLPVGSTEEINWTLRIRGETLTMPSNLSPLYEIEGLVSQGTLFPGNTPPVVRLAPDGPSGQGPGGATGTLVATAGVGAALRVWADDDGLPPPPDPSKVMRSLQNSYRRGNAVAAQGMTMSWEASTADPVR